MLAVVVAGLVTAAVGGWLIARQAGEALRTEINQQNEEMALNLAQRLDDRLRTRVVLLQAVTTRQEIGQLGPEVQNELNVVLRVLPEIDRLMVFVSGGSALAAASATRLVDLDTVEPRPELTQNMSSGTFQASLVPGTPARVELAVPIENPPGSPQGMLVAEIPLAEVAAHLDEVSSSGERKAFLTRADGTIVVHHDRERVERGERFSLPEASLASFGRFRGLGPDGAPSLLAAAPATSISAVVVVQQPEALVRESVSNSGRDLALILLAVIMVTVLTVVVVGRYLLAPLRPMAMAARSIGRGEHGSRVPSGGFGEVGRLGRELNRMAESLEQRIMQLRESRAAEAAMKEQSRLAETLYRVGSVLTTELDPQEVVQAVTVIATDLTGARFGAFVRLEETEEGKTHKLRALAGVPRKQFTDLVLPVGASILDLTLERRTTVRSGDLTCHADYDPRQAGRAGAEGHPSVISYLAVPVVSSRGADLGSLVFGHERPGVFLEFHEKLAEGIAAQAAIAIENADLYTAQRSVAETLQRSLLPATLPEVPGLAMTARYLPAAAGGLEVGGDWYDVIKLDSGQVVAVVGDVVGRGLIAAGTMGQLCHAVRAFAFENPSPSDLLERLNRFLNLAGNVEQFATVVVALFDPRDGSLRVANAGHPPPLMLARSTASFLDQEPGAPIGATSSFRYGAMQVALESGDRLILYTDGLVEDRALSLDEGLERLRRAAQSGPADIEEFCDHLVREAAGDRDVEDDIAVLVLEGRPVKAFRSAEPVVKESSNA